MNFPTPQIGSFRTRAVILAILIALAPLAYVYLGPLYEKFVQQRLEDNLWEAAEQTTDALAPIGPAEELPRPKLQEIANQHDIWLQVTDHQGKVAWSVNQALDNQKYETSMRQALGDAPSTYRLRDYLREQPPLTERSTFNRARQRGRATNCKLAQDGRLLTCLEIRRIPPSGERGPLYIHLQDASVRGVRELSSDRYPMFQLVLQLLGIGVVVALAVGWWTVLPVQKLREQVVDRASPPVSTDRVDVHAGGEVHRLADAFNGLLEALEERRQATKAYMADIAHEVKNPVAAIGTAAERLEADDLDPERVARIRRVLTESSQRLNRLVSRFLELARAEAGLPDEKRTSFDLGELVERLTEQLRDDARFPDLTVDARITSARIEAVPGHLETAIRNLLENGASFADSRLEVRLTTDGQHLELAVTDDGPGIPDEDLPHVFDRFFSRRPGNEGTGLGLAMTRAVIQAHDGQITVDSTPGHGTTFTLTLPTEP